MRSIRVYEFRGEFQAPELFLAPLQGPDITTLHGKRSDDEDLRQAFSDLVGEREENDVPIFVDIEQEVDFDFLIDRFMDVTGGISPGSPQLRLDTPSPEIPLTTILGQEEEDSDRRLNRFYATTGFLPHLEAYETLSSGIDPNGRFGGIADKLRAEIRLPHDDPELTALLHELGHCTMGVIGLLPDTTTRVNPHNINAHPMNFNYRSVSHGLVHLADGEFRGMILEEAVAEAIGKTVNQKLGIVKPLDPRQTVPDVLTKYIIDGHHAAAGPAAASLELIAAEAGMSPLEFFKMLTNYANVGVFNADARADVAEVVYKGTRGKLTLADIEGLPYPINKQSGLTLLWAVESSLDIPLHDSYSQYFRF